VPSVWSKVPDVWIRFDRRGAVLGATARHGMDGDRSVDGDRPTILRLERVDVPDPADCTDVESELDRLVFDERLNTPRRRPNSWLSSVGRSARSARSSR
jgi:hypothetical protein